MAASNSTIIYPTVPNGEDDPLVRINTMIKIWNDGLPTRKSRGRLDNGLYHEIQTALFLSRQHKITHGKPISRPLTAAEEKAGLPGHSQMIKVPLKGKYFRELDVVYDNRHIVEAKDKSSVDTSQLKDNVLLAKLLGGKAIYAIPTNASQEKALKAAYKTAFPADEIMAMEVIQIPRTDLGTMYFKNGAKPDYVATREAIDDPSFNCDEGEDYDYDEPFDPYPAKTASKKRQQGR